ncbi:MAG TPA: TIGR04133 family radical SAM/SPASM protein [Chitinispirillaceae bacterium]|nr:TIGR04133 family radical SAM/SPASM protein [Chitinispirillaceae bacterium]
MIKAEKISLKKKIALNLYSVKKNIDAHVHELRYLFWECTTRCNMNCLHCGSDCKSDSQVPDMPAKDFLNVLKSLKNRVNPSKMIVAITGGEPLVREDLADTGFQIRSLGYPWGIVTNGYLMTARKFERLLKSGIASMAISLDGLESEHNWFRGRSDSFKKAIFSIELASDASKKGLYFDVVTCVNQRNIVILPQIKELLVKFGVTRWRLVSIFPKGRACDNDELKLSGSQLVHLMNFIMETRREGKIIASYGCEGFLGEYEMEVRDIPFNCGAGIGIGSVLVDGSISACPSLRQDYIQGNIYKDDFWDVWNNRFQVMRNREWAKTGECKNCKVWKHCKGNGLHLRDQKSGELLFCNYRHLTGNGDIAQ